MSNNKILPMNCIQIGLFASIIIQKQRKVILFFEVTLLVENIQPIEEYLWKANSTNKLGIYEHPE